MDASDIWTPSHKVFLITIIITTETFGLGVHPPTSYYTPYRNLCREPSNTKMLRWDEVVSKRQHASILMSVLKDGQRYDTLMSTLLKDQTE